jgi:hypothetical protein
LGQKFLKIFAIPLRYVKREPSLPSYTHPDHVLLLLVLLPFPAAVRSTVAASEVTSAAAGSRCTGRCEYRITSHK